MAKNFVKKSLAVGSVAAMSIFGLVAPADAAVTRFTSAPIVGSSYKAILGSAFILKTTVTGAAAGGSNVSFLVTGATSSQLLVDTEDVASVAGLDASDFAGGDSPTVDEDADDKTYIEGTTAAAATPYVLTSVALDLDAAGISSTAERTVTLTPFEDTNADGVYDADVDGAKGSTVSITFVPAKNVSVNLVAAHDGDANTTDYSLTFDGLANGSMAETTDVAQLAVLDAFLDGVDQNLGYEFDEDDWSAADAAYILEGAATGAAAGSIVTSKVYVGEYTTAARSLRDNLADTDVTAYGSLSISAGANPYVIDTGADAWDVRSGDGQFTITIDVYGENDLGNNELPLAGQTVNWVVSENGNDSLDADSVISAGGKSLQNKKTGTTEKFTVSSVTNADGTATLTVSYKDLADDADTFKISADVANDAVGSEEATFTVTDPATAYVVVTNVSADSSIIADLDTDVTVNVALRDEFGLVPTGTHRVEYEVDTTPATTGWVLFNSSGRGSFKVSEETAGDYTIAFGTAGEIQTKNTSGNWVASLTADDSLTSLTVSFVDGPTTTAKYIEKTAGHSSATDEVAIVDETLFSANLALSGSDYFRTAAGTLFAEDAVGTDRNDLKVTVLDEDNLALSGGAQVTFSAADVMFVDDSELNFGLGTLTVSALDDGTATVYFYSNKSGTHTVTVTSGAATKTIKVVVGDPVEADIASWNVSGAAYASAGSTYTFTATLLDGYGNVVPSIADDGNNILSSDYEGPGLVVGSLPTEVNSKGQLSVKVLIGSNDTGKGTFTVVYDDDEDLTTVTDQVSKTFSFTIGTAPAAAKVNVGSFNGKLVVYANGYNGKKISWKVGGKWGTAVAASDTARFARVTPRKGVTVSVQIYVDGVLTLTKSVVTK